MDIAEIMAACEAKQAVTSDYPFGEQPKCYRVGGKIFAQVFPTGVAGALRILLEDEGISRDTVCPMVILRCDPMTGDFYRTRYPGAVLRPYHTPPQKQPYANTVLLDGRVPGDALGEMIDHAYTVVFQKLTKKLQRQILGDGEAG